MGPVQTGCKAKVLRRQHKLLGRLVKSRSPIWQSAKSKNIFWTIGQLTIKLVHTDTEYTIITFSRLRLVVKLFLKGFLFKKEIWLIYLLIIQEIDWSLMFFKKHKIVFKLKLDSSKVLHYLKKTTRQSLAKSFERAKSYEN